jgi:uncharacterized protein YecT (DUF1311 family)
MVDKIRISTGLTAFWLIGAVGIGVSGCSSSSDHTPAASATTPAASWGVGASATSGSVDSANPAAGRNPANPASTRAVAPGSEPRYLPLVEPFSAPASCDENGNTLEMTGCVLQQVMDVDSTVDNLQRERFERAPQSERPKILAEDARWLKGRSTACAKVAKGGSIDQVNIAQCLLRASQNRVETLNDLAGSG